MSIVDRRGVEIDLPRIGPDAFWQMVRAAMLSKGTKRQRQRRWKYLAMLALRENAGWPLDAIAAAWGHPKGHIPRVLRSIKAELRELFPESSPEFFQMPEEDEGA